MLSIRKLSNVAVSNVAALAVLSFVLPASVAGSASNAGGVSLSQLTNLTPPPHNAG